MIKSDRVEAIVADLGLTDYMEILELQRNLVSLRNEGKIPDVIIFNEHEDVYTVGIHRNPEELLDSDVEPVQIERGGSITYHGKGQIVAYFILNLKERRTNIKSVIESVQAAIVTTLSTYRINSEGRLGKETGVWTESRKICSIGFAIKEFSTLHGVALNVSTDLDAFSRIRPCGYPSEVMTSMSKESGRSLNMHEVRRELEKQILKNLGIEKIKKVHDLSNLRSSL